MREIRALAIYLTGVTGLMAVTAMAAGLALSEYHSQFPQQPAVRSAAASEKPQLAGIANDIAASTRQPVWIEPTTKYVYAIPATPPVRQEAPAATAPVKTVPKKSPRHTVAQRVNPEARQAYGYASGNDATSRQLLILPLQHQAPQ